jgi:HlyD family secretion protein
MNKSLSILSALTCLVFVGGCNSKEAAGPATDAGTAPASSLDRVTAGAPIRKTLQLFTEQPGRVVAFEETPILSKLPGYVETVQFDIGDKVTKGQVLVRIHAPEYKDQLEQKLGLVGQSGAQVKQAEAALVAAEAASNSAKSMVAQAEAGVGRTDAEYARWDSELKRIQQLVTKGSVTPKLADETSSQFQSAEAARKEALALIESAKASQRVAEAEVLTAKADIDAAKAKLKVAQSDVAQAQTMLTYADLTAPFEGFITSRNVDAGHYVQPAGASNAKPLMTVASVSQVRVFVNVPESEATWVDAGYGKADAGDLVTILSPAFPSGKIEARVTRTSLQLDPQSRSLLVEIDLDNNELKLLPGAFVTTKMLLEQRKDVLTLPIGAIIKAVDGTKCCVVVDGKIQHRSIALGLRAGDDVEIKSGLDGSETVVLLRAGSLQDGQSVEIIVKK